jgi:hypothetical protein
MPSRTAERRRLRRVRAALGALALILFTAKTIVAYRTIGTDDALFWRVFAATVRRVGPIDIYSQHLLIRYNHPPPIGWMLVGFNRLTDLGVPFLFLIKLPSCVADVGTIFLVFELLRVRRPFGHAVAAAVVVAVSPVLFIISGFHGNTDPVFVFFTLLAVWLLVDRDRPALSGLAMAAAVGVKLVPVIVVPALFVAAIRRGQTLRWAIPAGVAVLASWLPAVLREYPVMKANVFGYEGQSGEWGVAAVLRGLGATGAMHAYAGPGRWVVLAVAALPAAYWAWRRPADLPMAVGLALVTFLALSPAFAPQYLSWVVAAGALLSPVFAGIYSAVAGTLLVILYTQWSNGFPWHRAHPKVATRFDLLMNLAAWLVVLCWAAFGALRLTRALRKSEASVPLNREPESEELTGAR